MEMRYANSDDLARIAEIEAAAFPETEAASEASLADRLRCYPNHFLIMTDDGVPIGFVNGMVTDKVDLTDDLYDDASLNDESAAWQMVFGLDMLPEYRRRGLAAMLLNRFIEDARAQKRRGVVLTCKDRLIHYYKKFGFVDEGISGSTHGGAVWHQMRLTF